jgi:23S rRNA pseudouridine2605 synthase
MRINRYLAEAGVASRRKAELLVTQGRVRINKEIVTDLSTQVNSPGDLVELDGNPVSITKTNNSGKIIALFKPAGYLTSHADKHHDKIIFDLLPQEFSLYKFAGRLDLSSRGLIFLSDSGDTIQNLTHPSHGPEKEYQVELESPLDALKVAKEFRIGIRDDGDTLRAVSVEPRRGSSKVFHIVLKEGKKRQIRRMFAKLDARVKDLLRTRIGNCKLASLNIKEGEYCEVSIEMVYN